MYETKATKATASDDLEPDPGTRKRSPSAPRFSLTTWTGAAYADNRLLYITVGAAAVLLGSIGFALWLCR